MGLEILTISDKNLNAAATIADSKENDGNDDKSLSSKELTAFMQAAYEQNCKPEDVFKIVNQVKSAEENDARLQYKAELNKKAVDLENKIKEKENEIASYNVQDKEITKNQVIGALKFGLGLIGLVASGLGIFSGIGAGRAVEKITKMANFSENVTHHATGIALGLGLIGGPTLSYFLGDSGSKQIGKADKLRKQKKI